VVLALAVRLVVNPLIERGYDIEVGDSPVESSGLEVSQDLLVSRADVGLQIFDCYRLEILKVIKK
jgi:hypothetical protein